VWYKEKNKRKKEGGGRAGSQPLARELSTTRE